MLCRNQISTFLWISILIIPYTGWSNETYVDSVKSIISHAHHDSTKIKALMTLGDLFKGSNPDSARFFYEKALRVSEKDDIQFLKFTALAEVKIAQTFVYQGNYENARRHNQKAEKLLLQNFQPDISAMVANISGLINYNRGEYDKALEDYRKAFDLAEESGDKSLEAKIYTNMSIIHYIKGNYDNAIELFKKPVEIGRELNDRELLSGSLINLGNVYLNLGMTDSANSCYNQSATVYAEMNSLDGLLLCHQNMGSIFYSKGEYDQALDAYKEALGYASQLDNKTEMAHSLHNIAEVYMRIGDYENSLGYYLKAIKQKEKISDKMGMATSYQGIGSLHFLLKNNNQALLYYQKALKLFTELDYPTGTVGVLCNMSNVYTAMNKLDTALTHYREALAVYEQTGDKTALSDVLLNIGNLYFEKGEYKKAVGNFNRSLALKTELSDKDGMAWANYYLALTDFNTKNFARAIEYGNKARALAKEVRALPTLSSAYEILMNANKGAGNHKEALGFAQQYIMLQDSLFKKEKMEAIAHAEMRWQSGKKQAQIEQLEKQQQLQKVELQLRAQQAQTQRLIMYGTATLLLFLIITIILILRIEKRKKDLLYQKQLSKINQMKMQNIRNRISPHFFFNALNTAVGPLKNYPEQNEAFENLIGLLRRSLENAEKSFIPLVDELSIVDSYIELHNMRMNGEIQYHKNVALNGQTSPTVPAMILQIPVENAIKHGLKPLDGPKKLWLDCVKKGNRIYLMVSDNGIGRKASETRTVGTGTGFRVLLQTIELLNMKNENKICFTIQDGNPGNETTGTCVSVSIPVNFKFEI